ncbi:MAG: acyl-CoA dehydrogenase family protein [Candidatus Dormiibacterota bacterium]
MQETYGLTPEDLEIQGRAASIVEELIPHETSAELNNGLPPDGILERAGQRVRELGLQAINMPRELGGGGFTMLQQVLVQEQTGRVTNALAWVIPAPAAWFPRVASDLQMQRWVLPTIRGELHECYAITEEGSGSDVDALTATATQEGDGYVLNGVKWHVTSFNEAQYVFFQARLAGGERAGAHAMFIVPLPWDGIRVVRTPAYMHTFAHQHPIVAFENVRVAVEHRIGDEGDGMTFAHEWFRYERLMIAARCLGAAARLIEEATEFARNRSSQGRPIIEHQAVQVLLADSITELFATKAMTYAVARTLDAGADTRVAHAQCSMVKLFASEMAGRVADRCLQVFGGRGYMRENVAERFYRELRVERIWEGTSEVQRVIIAGQLAKRGVAGLI